jgi:Tfp pilus assembly protein PilF
MLNLVKSHPTFWAAIVLTAIVLVSYGNTLENGFAYDDEGLVLHNVFIKHVSDWPKLFTTHYWSGIRDPNAARGGWSGLYRPLTSFSYALNYAAGGTAPMGYHAVNVVFHLLVVWFVFLLALELQMGSLPSFAAAALFAAHPIHTEAVSGVVGRAEVMMALGFLGSLWYAARGRRIVSLVFYCVALGSKEQALMFIPALLLYDATVSRIYAGRSVGTSLRIAVPRYSPYVIAMLAYLGLRWFALGGTAPPPVPFLANPLGHLDIWHRWIPALQVAGRYLWLSVWPRVLSLDYSYNSIPLATTFFDWPVLLSCAAWLALLILGIVSFRRRSAITFSIGLLFISFLPASNLLLPIGTIMGERLFYLPSVGLCLLAGLGIQALMDWRAAGSIAGRVIHRGAWSLLLIVSVAFIARTLVRNRDWKDTEHLARAANKVYPNNAKVQSILGRIAKDKGEWDKAIEHFRSASKIYPEYENIDVSFNTNLGIALIQKGRVDEGVKAIERAVQIEPGWSQVYYNLGFAYKTQGRYREAEAAYKRALVLNESDPRAYTGLSFLYLDIGRYADALASANLALQRDPGYIEALYTKARALELLNEPRKAADTYQRIVELNPWRKGMARKVKELRRVAP